VHALFDDRGRLDVARLALVDELVALDVDQVGAGAAELLGER